MNFPDDYKALSVFKGSSKGVLGFQSPLFCNITKENTELMLSG